MTVYDVTTYPGSVPAATDIGRVINEIIAEIKRTQTSPSNRPGAVIYIPPGHYDLLTRVVVDIAYLQIKGSGHGFMSQAIRDESDASKYQETQPGASHIRAKNTDGTKEAFLVERAGDPRVIGRLNGIEFRDFCIDGVSATKPYLPGSGKIGIRIASDNDSVKIAGMGLCYLSKGLVIRGADAIVITDNVICEVGTCIELVGASIVPRITNNFLISAWAGHAVYAEHADSLHVTGNSLLWHGSVRLVACGRACISANTFVSSWPGLIVLDENCHENLISGNHLRRIDVETVNANGTDDYFGLVQLNGNDNTVSGNHFSLSVAANLLRPAGASPTIVLVKGGHGNFIATNHVTTNVPGKVVLDASSRATQLIHTTTPDQVVAYSTDFTAVHLG